MYFINVKCFACFIYHFCFRYSPKAPPKIKVPCEHYSKSYRCTLLRKVDIVKFHAAFNKSPSKIDQDNFILQHSKASTVSRHRPRTGTRKMKGMQIVYYCRRRNNLIPVCRKTFLEILGIKEGRVNGVIARNFKSGGASASESRGGNHKKHKYAGQKKSIQKFIKRFKPLEIHYCRGSIKCRQYLSSDLNINKLYKMYKEQPEAQFQTVKASYF